MNAQSNPERMHRLQRAGRRTRAPAVPLLEAVEVGQLLVLRAAPARVLNPTPCLTALLRSGQEQPRRVPLSLQNTHNEVRPWQTQRAPPGSQRLCANAPHNTCNTAAESDFRRQLRRRRKRTCHTGGEQAECGRGEQAECAKQGARLAGASLRLRHRRRHAADSYAAAVGGFPAALPHPAAVVS